MKLIFFCVVLILIVSAQETDIKNQILLNYRKDSLPPISYNQSSLPVYLGIMIRAINNINHMDGTFKLNIWLRYKWKDERLSWENEEEQTIIMTTDPSLSSSIWIPDIYLYNTAENPFVDMAYTNALVDSQGNIILSRPGILTSTCSFDLAHFPYDIQTCFLKLGSWSYTTNKIYLHPFNPVIDISNYQENEEWILENYSAVINEKKYACCSDSFQDITFQLKLRRKSGYYDQNLAIPAFATASLTIFTMLIPWNSGERISYSTTIMLSIIVFLLILSEHLPKSSNKPLLSVMFISLMVYSLCGLIFTLIISFARNKAVKVAGKLEIIYTVFFSLSIIVIIVISFLYPK